MLLALITFFLSVTKCVASQLKLDAGGLGIVHRSRGVLAGGVGGYQLPPTTGRKWEATDAGAQTTFSACTAAQVEGGLHRRPD